MMSCLEVHRVCGLPERSLSSIILQLAPAAMLAPAFYFWIKRTHLPCKLLLWNHFLGLKIRSNPLKYTWFKGFWCSKQYLRLWRKFEKSSKTVFFVHPGANMVIYLQEGFLVKMNLSSIEIIGMKSHSGSQNAFKSAQIYLIQWFLMPQTIS